MEKNVNILIVHYNTPYLTGHLAKSINKFTPNAQIYIFDNSDKAPFDASGFDNITIFDNTKGKYIDFNKWLQKYPKRNASGGKVNGWGSAKHCVSVEKCMSLINGNFILLDSDVLLKKDISELFDPSKIFVGEVVTQLNSKIKRVLPYICFINNDACKKNNVHYFDENRMHGLMCNKINRAADNYDTGAAFYLNCGTLPRKEIKVEDYVVHYSGASWKEVKERKYKHDLSPKQWIEKYGKLWKTNEEIEMTRNRKVVYTCITGNYEPLDDPFFISEGFDYVCFTDSKIKSDMWEVRPIPDELKSLTPVKKQRCIKVNPHKYLKEYDLSIWVDGSVKLTADLNKFLTEKCSEDASIFIPNHPSRKCIYQEMIACERQKKDTHANIEPQRIRYREERFPENYGLVQSNIIIRKHNEPDCIRLMETWWEEIRKGSHRDQLSFNYAAWKNSDIKIVFLDKTTCSSAYFKWDASHGKRKTPIVAKASVSTSNTAANIDMLLQKRTEPKPAPKPTPKPVNKIKRVEIKNPAIRKKLIAKSIKIFLKPY